MYAWCRAGDDLAPSEGMALSGRHHVIHPILAMATHVVCTPIPVSLICRLMLLQLASLAGMQEVSLQQDLKESNLDAVAHTTSCLPVILHTDT